MMRRSGEARGIDAERGGSVDFWSRPRPVRYAGWAVLVGAAVLILGGAYRMQSNMITSGLMFLFLGSTMAADTLRGSWLVRLGAIALAIVGLLYALRT